MTVIDSLVVKLGLDTKDFQRGSKAADADFKKTKTSAKEAGKQIEQSGQQGAEFFHQLRKAAIQFFSVLTVGRGLADFTRTVIGTGAQLDRMATRVGESASQLSRWQGAVRQSGGTAEGFLSTVQGLSQQMTQLNLTGDAPMAMLLRTLGVGAADASGKAKPILQLLRDIGNELESKPWSNADKFNLLSSAGIDEGTINLLMRGRQEREKLLAAQKEYTDADARAAREAQEKWEQVKQNIEKTTQVLIIKLLPALERIANGMVKFAEVSVPILANLVDGFVSLNEATDGWLVTLGLALVALKGIAGLLAMVGIGGGAAAAGTGAAVGGAAAGGLLARIMGLAKGGGALGLLSYSGGLNTNEDAELARRRAMGPTISGGATGSWGESGGASGSWGYDMANKMAEAEKASGLPAGLLSSIMKQEIGDRKEFIDDPSKYHYEKDANGKRKSSAFGPFGILDSTAQKPGYGVEPLKDKSISEQIRFAAQYSAARIKAAGGDVAAGLAGYGEGAPYAAQVMSRMSGGVMSGVPMSGMSGAGQQAGNISIGEVKVYTQATDANGIARDIKGAIIRQADTGMR